MIHPSTIERIKEQADIIEVISEFVELKKSGSSYKGLSPFHTEKTPSFMVSPSKGIFKDFSSGKGGDSITFIMEVEGLTYVEALKYLAKKYGIQIEEKELTPDQIKDRDKKESLLLVLNHAKEYYRNHLHNSDEGKSIGLSYFKERGFRSEIIDDFDLGFSPNQWDSYYKHALENQFSQDLLEQAGLIIVKEGGKKFDRFRNRVMFPIHNVSGKVIAFGARILTEDKKQPKYLNSPETEVYHKSHILYGIFQAKSAIRNADRCFLVEGYTDVLAMHQAGVANVVASSGTALTRDQIKLIKRYTKNITVLYDGDDAGLKASLRGIDLILEEGLNVQVVIFPEGHDPDSYSKKVGSAEFTDYIASAAQDFISFKTDYYLKESSNDPIKRAEAIGDIVQSIIKIPDPVKQAVFFKVCSEKLGVEESVLQASATQKKQEVKKKVVQRPVSPPSSPMGMDDGPPPDLFVPDDIGGEQEKESAVNIGEQVALNQEFEIVRLLLVYAHEFVEDDFTVSEYILENTEDLVFKNPVLAVIINEFREEVKKGNVLKGMHFLNHSDEDVVKTVKSMLSNKYEISEKWQEFEIYPKEEKNFLDKVTHSTILRLRWRDTRRSLERLTDKLANAKEDDEIDELQKEYIKFKQLELTIAGMLGNVTIR